jgi:hypothetical protein
MLSNKIIIPSLSLAFEYQGEPHYYDIPIYMSSRKKKTLDHQKKQISKDFGLTLIPVPFWWDKRQESLISTIRQIRPDVPLPSSNSPAISDAIPDKIRGQMKYKPSSAKRCPDSLKPHGFIMTEKYDGVRVYWDGKDLYTSSMIPINIPSELRSTFPSLAFEGELW